MSDKNPRNVYILSFDDAGMAIFDTMRHIRPDVSTVCVGLAARYDSSLSASFMNIIQIKCSFT